MSKDVRSKGFPQLLQTGESVDLCWKLAELVCDEIPRVIRDSGEHREGKVNRLSRAVWYVSSAGMELSSAFFSIIE